MHYPDGPKEQCRHSRTACPERPAAGARGRLEDVVAPGEAGGDYQAVLVPLSRQALAVQENERRHLARELHDEIGQSLTALGLTLEMSARCPPEAVHDNLRKARALVEELANQVRDLSLRLRPPMLDDLGLLPTLRWHLDRYLAYTGIRVTLHHAGLERRFGTDVETSAYRIVQEALTNVARHAGVNRVTVAVRADRTTLRIRVEDRGNGFDGQTVRAGSSSGLIGMRERAGGLGGRLIVESAPGAGTCLIAELPICDPGTDRSPR